MGNSLTAKNADVMLENPDLLYKLSLCEACATSCLLPAA
jgi:hypothetical protein